MISLNTQQLPVFTADGLRNGDPGRKYEAGILEMDLAAQVIHDIHSYLGSGHGNVYPFSRNVVAPHVVEIVVDQLRTKCGFPASYVLNDYIVVTASAVIERSTAEVVALQQQIAEQDGQQAETHVDTEANDVDAKPASGRTRPFPHIGSGSMKFVV